jgi:hypothetical protein
MMILEVVVQDLERHFNAWTQSVSCGTPQSFSLSAQRALKGVLSTGYRAALQHAVEQV